MTKVLILCAGYGTRLQKGVKEDPSQSYQHLLGVSKPLLPLGGKPLISYWVEQLEQSKIVSKSDIFLVVNDQFYLQFIHWAQDEDFPIENVINDGTKSNEDRLGAVKDIELIVSQKNITEPLVVIAGDTLFLQDFSFKTKFEEYKKRQDSSLVLFYNEENTEKCGILELDSSKRVTNFIEKPKCTETKSRKACPCFYMLHPKALQLLQQYVAEAFSLEQVDAAGQFIRWLFSRHPVFASQIEGRFDIGALDSYIVANDHFTRLNL